MAVAEWFSSFLGPGYMNKVLISESSPLSYLLTVAVMNMITKRDLGKDTRVYLAYRLQSVVKGSQGGNNSRQELTQRPWRSAAHPWLAQPRSTCPGIAVPTVSWALLQH